jgi:Tol biopolymer transport system component
MKTIEKLLLIFSLMFLASCSTLSGLPAEAPGASAAPPGEETSSVLQGEPNGGWSATFSPDGSQIAFLSGTLHTPADLWVMNADGTGARRLTARGAEGFRWAADGKSIQFSARRKGFDEVLSIRLDGAEEKRVPGLPPAASVPVYSPDGQLLAFTAPDEKKVRNLWIATVDGARSEAVTEQLGVRSVFWGTDSRKVYYEVGESYGVGLWEMDLSTMESRVVLNKYIGTPDFSPATGLIAFAYPDKPGEYEVRTMQLDGSDVKSYAAPRLQGRWLAWDADGTGVYYLAQDVAGRSEEAADKAPSEQEKPAVMHQTGQAEEFEHVGVTSLWRLDLASGREERVSPTELHLAGFSLPPDGKQILLAGVRPESYSGEVFRLDLATGELAQLVSSRPAWWMATPTRDSAKVAFFTNEPGVDTLKVVDADGEERLSLPGVIQEGDTRISWLPESEALVLFSGRGLFAFAEKGPVEFANRSDHRAFIYADVSIQEDKVLLNSIPKFGETPGLYLLEAVDGKFVQTDLRYPTTAGEYAADLYLQPKWSLDGKRIAFTDRIDVWIMNADGTGRKWITDYASANAQGTGAPALASFPVWSVNGEMLCYTLTVFAENGLQRQLWVVRADGSEPHMLYSEEVDSAFQLRQQENTHPPFFDVTDERIIFTGVKDGLPDILAVEIKSGKVHRLTETGAIFPVLLPEEDLILYTSLEGNAERLWVMNSHGTQKRPFEIKAPPTEPPVAVGAEKGAETGGKEEGLDKTAPAGQTGK